MNDWLNGKAREEQIQDDTDKYQMMDCTILGSASIKGLQEPFKLRITCYSILFSLKKEKNLFIQYGISHISNYFHYNNSAIEL